MGIVQTTGMKVQTGCAVTVQRLGQRIQMNKRPAKDGYEQDAYYARRFYHWRAGVVKQIKRRTHKRERQEAKTEIKKDLQ